MKILSAVLAGIAVLSLVSCKKEETAKEVAPVKVVTNQVTTEVIEGGHSYSGVIEESDGTVLSFKVGGTIKTINVAEGQKVNKGQLIASLDNNSLLNNYHMAEAVLATAQDTYDRMKILHEKNAIPPMKWVEVENGLTQAKSACQIAKNNLDDARIYAPFSGMVSVKMADIGNTAMPSAPIVKIVEISPVKIAISVSENDIAHFNSATVASFSSEALGAKTFEARLVEKGVSADPMSRTYTVKFLCSNPQGELLPGMLCDVRPDLQSSHEEIVMPTGAVLLDFDNSRYVWKVVDGLAVKQIVKLGGYTTSGIVITEGLSTGDIVITEGMQKVSRGIKVQSINK